MLTRSRKCEADINHQQKFDKLAVCLRIYWNELIT